MTSGLILAAGSGSRFTRAPKQLAEVGGRPLIEWSISAHCAVIELERVVLVLGAWADEILTSVDLGRAEPVICEDWASGQSASLKAGMRALGDSDAVIVTLGDQPLVNASVIRRLVGEPVGTRAVYRGQPGHPVVLGRELLPKIEALRGDQGAKPLLAGGREIDCSSLAPGANADIDTVEELDSVRRLLET